jgi:hypothetical protein
MKLKFGELVCSECDGTGEGKTKKFKYIKNVNKDIINIVGTNIEVILSANCCIGIVLVCVSSNNSII